MFIWFIFKYLINNQFLNYINDKGDKGIPIDDRDDGVKKERNNGGLVGLENGEMLLEENQREFDNTDDSFERNFNKEKNI